VARSAAIGPWTQKPRQQTYRLDGAAGAHHPAGRDDRILDDDGTLVVGRDDDGYRGTYARRHTHRRAGGGAFRVGTPGGIGRQGTLYSYDRMNFQRFEEPRPRAGALGVTRAPRAFSAASRQPAQGRLARSPSV